MNRDLADLLDDIVEILTRYVVFPLAAQPAAIALWIVHTHVIDEFDTTPYLEISSAEKRSGKTRVLDVLKLVVARPWRAITPSEAVVFRKIAKDQPTLLLDEVDAIYGPKAREHEGLRALLNAGHRKGTTVPRCVGKDFQVVDFEVFCPKAFAAIGTLPDTVSDRSILIRLARKSPREKVGSFRFREARAEAEPLRERLERWSEGAQLSGCRPAIPVGLNDRAADGWEPLLAIADTAGEPWATRARDAALALHATVEDDESVGVQLLGDIRDVFHERGEPEAIFSQSLLLDLCAWEGSPWGDWKGNGLGAHELARRLKPYDIRPGTVRIGPDTLKGYRLEHFVDAWDRYLPPSLQEEFSPSQRHTGAKNCDGVTDEGPPEKAEGLSEGYLQPDDEGGSYL